MTGKQRALCRIRGEKTDRPSVLPSIDVAYAPECIGATVGECFLDPKRNHFCAHLAAAEARRIILSGYNNTADSGC